MITQEQFGAICAYMRIAEATVRQWKCRGYVPPNRQLDFLEAAGRLGFTVNRSDMDNVKRLPRAEKTAA